MILKTTTIFLLLLSLASKTALALEYNITAIPNSNWASTTSLNDNGQIVGYSVYNSTGFYWDAQNGYTSLNTLIGTNSNNIIMPADINNNGQILFNYNNSSSLWSPTEGMICENLPFHATAVNDNSTIIGTDRDDNLVKWNRENGTVTLDTSGRTIWYAGDINNNEKIVGTLNGVGTAEQREIHRAFIYDDLNGIIELETTTNLLPVSNPRSSAFAINNNNQIVGSSEYATNTHGVIWDNALDISVMTESLSGDVRIEDINDTGTIICNTFSIIRNNSYICTNETDWININNFLNDPLLDTIYELQDINNSGQILANGEYDLLNR